ncbi:MAG: hypothetical protein AAFN81_09505 [Bacteroidota bacterium]
MEAHQQLSNQEFAQQFVNCTLPPQWFSHTAHLRLAWILLQQHGLEATRQLMCEQIQNFDRTHGDGTKYHRTLTEAAVQVVYHFAQKGEASSFNALLEEFPRLHNDFKGLLFTHYSPQILFADEAKATYAEPDLMRFPA